MAGALTRGQVASLTPILRDNMGVASSIKALHAARDSIDGGIRAKDVVPDPTGASPTVRSAAERAIANLDRLSTTGAPEPAQQAIRSARKLLGEIPATQLEGAALENAVDQLRRAAAHVNKAATEIDAAPGELAAALSRGEVSGFAPFQLTTLKSAISDAAQTDRITTLLKKADEHVAYGQRRIPDLQRLDETHRNPYGTTHLKFDSQEPGNSARFARTDLKAASRATDVPEARAAIDEALVQLENVPASVSSHAELGPLNLSFLKAANDIDLARVAVRDRPAAMVEDLQAGRRSPASIAQYLTSG